VHCRARSFSTRFPQAPRQAPETDLVPLQPESGRPDAIAPGLPTALLRAKPYMGVKSRSSLIFATVSATSLAVLSRSESEMISTGVCM